MKPMEPKSSPKIGKTSRRKLKFMLIVCVCTLVCGGGVALYPYTTMFDTNKSEYRRNESMKEAFTDTWPKFKSRLVFGTAGGALVGLAYVVYCLRNRTEP